MHARRVSIVIGVVVLILGWVGAAQAYMNVTSCRRLPPVEANEVRIFRYPDFVGECQRFTMRAGQRHHQVTSLVNRDWRKAFPWPIGSIMVGANVAVIIFVSHHFRDRSATVRATTADFTSQGLYGSLVVFPRGLSHPVGVTLYVAPAGWRPGQGELSERGGDYRQFFPLPDFRRYRTASYRYIMNPVDRRATRLRLHGRVSVTLYQRRDFGPNSLLLPGSAGRRDEYNLSDYSFARTARSLIINDEGPRIMPGSMQPYCPPLEQWDAAPRRCVCRGEMVRNERGFCICPGDRVWLNGRCRCRRTMVWDASRGQCVCPAGMIWDSARQACVPESSPPDRGRKRCPAGQYYHKGLRKCLTGTYRPPRRCAPGWYWNARLRRCVRRVLGRRCPVGQYWNARFKRCLRLPVRRRCRPGWVWRARLKRCVRLPGTRRCPMGWYWSLRYKRCLRRPVR